MKFGTRTAGKDLKWLLLLSLLCYSALKVTAQLNVDSLERLLQRTNKPLEHLDLLRTLGETGDVDLLGTCAKATIHYADSLMTTDHPDTFQVLTRKAYGYWMLGSHHQRKGRIDSTTACARKAADLWKQIGDQRQAILANNFLGSDLMARGDVTQAFTIFKESLALSEILKDSVGMADTHMLLGTAFDNSGDYPSALDHYNMALALAEAGYRTEVIGQCLHSVGWMYSNQAEQDTALILYRRAVEAYAATGWPQRAAAPLADIASAHIAAKDYKAALGICEEGLELFGEDLDSFGTFPLYSVMGQAYQAMGDLGQAIHFTERALAVVDPLELNQVVYIRVQLGRIWFAKLNYRESLKNAEQALALVNSFELDLTKRYDVYTLLADIYSKTGPADKALFYYKEANVYSDSINNVAIRKKLVAIGLRKQAVTDSTKAAEARAELQGEHQQEMSGEQGKKRNFMFAGLAVLVVAGGLFIRLRHTRKAKSLVEGNLVRSDTLLNNILPSDIAEELKHKGEAQARDIDNVSILFTDFKGFTEASAKLSPQELVAELNTCFAAFDHIITARGIEKIKTIGDAYMCAGGLPGPKISSPADVVHAALEMQTFMITRKKERDAQNLPAFEMRVGIHTGPVVAGIVGVKKFQYDIWGDTVNTASRMESSGEVGKVNISEATYALVKNAVASSQWAVGSAQDGELPTANGPLIFSFTSRGKVQAKGKGEMEMYFVELA